MTNERMRAALLSALLGSMATPAAAQQADCPGGDLTTVRTSVIKPGGTVEGLRQAMAAHAKWYADHGYTADQFAFGQVVAYDRTLKRRAPVAGKYVTLHWRSSEVPRDKRDAAWNAYVALYAANSRIAGTTVVCMLK